MNPRYLESLKRYIDLFDGRGHVFEYYADAILFGGMGFATPSIIVRDLNAYHRMGLRSISCLTFGAFSVLAYPVNLETFARATRSLDIDPDAAWMTIARGAVSAMRCGDGSGVSRDRARLGDGAYLWRRDASAAGACRRARRSARLLEAAAAMRDGVAAAKR